MFYMLLINGEYTGIFEGDNCGLLQGRALSAFVLCVTEKSQAVKLNRFGPDICQIQIRW
jgi:hypothetical protein